MSCFTNENILSAPSRFITEYKMIIQICHSRKRCQDRCYINWLQDFHLMLYLNSQFLLVKYRKKCRDLYYLTPKSINHQRVMMNQRVYYFHGLGLSYFCSTKALPWIIADYLQWAIYIKTKIRVYMCIKNKLA